MSDNSDHIILSANNLNIGYTSRRKKTLVLQGLTMDLKKGELVCLVGHNGIGKSTLLRTLSGVQPSLGGEVKIAGKGISEMSSMEIAKTLSLVLTDRIMAGNLSVYDLVALGRHPYTNWYGSLSEEDHQKIEEAIKLTRIEYIRNRQVHELSDGQRQKALIARALSQDGEIIILDEPTAHLDLNNKISVMKLLHELAEKTDKAILFATHELEFTIQIADKLWIVGCDEPIVTGSPEDLILNKKFDMLLFEEDLIFDRMSGKFGILKAYKNEVSLSGSGEAHFWTENALKRIGIKVTTVKQNTRISVIKEGDGYLWTITKNSNVYKVDSIDKLIQRLKS
ncbi:ABC transporter ATP-binding protein [Bacteroidota bacterium]